MTEEQRSAFGIYKYIGLRSAGSGGATDDYVWRLQKGKNENGDRTGLIHKYNPEGWMGLVFIIDMCLIRIP